MNRSIAGLQFTTATGGWNLGGSAFTLTLGASGISTVGQTSGTDTVAANLLVGSNQTWVAGTGGILDVTGNVSGNSNLTIGTTGNTGTVALSGNNSYGGTATVSFGTLQLNNTRAARAAVISIGTANGLAFGAGSANPYLVAGLTGASAQALTTTAAGAANVRLGTFNNATANTYSGALSGAGSLVKTGDNSQTFSGANSYSGGTTLNRGTLTGTQTTGTPFGSGDVTINGGTLAFAPSVAGVSSVTVADGSAGTKFTYGGGGVVALTNNGTSLTVTAGNATPTGSVLVRSGKGTLVLRESASGNLGTTEFFKVNGTAPTLVNNMVNASITGQTGVTAVGNFLTYNANGFASAAAFYTNHAASFTTVLNEIANVTASSTITNGASGANAYALILQSGANATLSGVVTIGTGVAGTQSGIILNGSGGTRITGGTLNFGAAEGVISIFTANSTAINSTITGTGGVTVGGVVSGGNFGGSFSFGGTNTFTGGVTFNNIQVSLGTNDAGYGDISNSLTLNNMQFYGTNTQVLNPRRNMIIGEGGATFHAGNQTTSFGGNISGTGPLKIDGVNSGGFSVLAGNNTFTGGLILQGGYAAVASEANIGGASSTIEFGATTGNLGTLSIIGNDITSFGSHNVVFNSSGGNVGLDIQSASNTFTMDRIMNQGTGGFTKYGAGTVVLTAANAYTGTTVLQGGNLNVNAQLGGSLSSSTGLTFNGGNFNLLGKTTGTTSQTVGNVTVGARGGILTVNSNGGSGTTLTMGTVGSSTTAGSTLDIRTVGSSTITTTTAATGGILGGNRVTYNGTDWASNGASGSAIGAYAGYTGLATSGSSANALQTGSATLTGAATANSLKITTSGTGQSLAQGGNLLTLTTGGLLFAGADDYTISGGTLASATTGASDLIIHQGGAGALTISSVIQNGVGASTLTKAGTGKLVLSGSNTYTGQTYINGGTVSVSANDQFGAVATGAAINLNGATLQATASFALNNGGPNARNIILGSSGGTVDVINGSTLTLTGNMQSFSGSEAGPASLTLTSSDASNGTFVIGGTGRFDGGVNINGGTLRMASSSALNAGAGNTLNFGTGSTGVLQMNNFSTTFSGLSSSSTTAVVENGAVGSGTSTLTVINGGNNTYAGTIRNNSGSGAGIIALSKAGTGTLTLSGANSYTGTTVINAGTLLITGAHTNAGAYTVNGGGTLGGTSSITTASNAGITLAAGAKLAPGTTGSGTLTAALGTGTFDITGAVTATGTSALVFELGAVGVNSDQFVLSSGTMNIGNGLLEFDDFNFTTLAGFGAGTYVLFDTNGFTLGNALGSNLSGLVGGLTSSLTINGSNDIVLNVVPEPSTYALLGGGLAFLAYLRRRKVRV